LLDIFEIIDLSVNPYFIIDIIILGIFIFDYVLRFILSKNKLSFIKSNIPDLLAIIPLNSLFSFFRVFRLLKFTRLLKLTKLLRLYGFIGKIKNKLDRFLHTNGFIYMIYISLTLILSSSFIMMYVEKQSFFDALWWSIVTCTTVGYGDISPATPFGRVVAIFLMIFGIGFISMLTGTITTFFSQKSKSNNNNSVTIDISEITKDMTEEQLKELSIIAKAIKTGLLS